MINQSANLQIEERWRWNEGRGGDQSEYGLNVVDQFPNTGRSVRIGMDTKSFYTFTFFLRFLQSTGRIKAKTAF